MEECPHPKSLSLMERDFSEQYFRVFREFRGRPQGWG
jgi:hypothetical protein